jgi:hypothetical protein
MQAHALKGKLEAKNKAMLKRFMESGEGPCPKARWFELRDPDALTWTPGQQLRWRYKGGYWAARAAGKWDDVPSPF